MAPCDAVREKSQVGNERPRRPEVSTGWLGGYSSPKTPPTFVPLDEPGNKNKNSKKP